MKRNYEDLNVWKEAINLVDDVYKITKTFPKEEIYALVSQMRRSAVSIPSNIAEGAERNGKKEFIQFLSVSAGSLAELKTQIIIASRNGMIETENYDLLIKRLELVSKMLNGLRKSLNPNT